MRNLCLPALALSGAALFLASCASAPAVARRSEKPHPTSHTETASVGRAAHVVVNKGSVYQMVTDAKKPGVILEEGKLMLYKPKDGQTCDLVMGAARAHVTGTTILAEKHGTTMVILLVEGQTRVSWGNRAGEYRTLHTGQMLVMDSKQKTLPNPVLVNLKKLQSREPLLSSKYLGTEKLALIAAAGEQQEKLLATGHLVVLGRNPDGTWRSFAPGDPSRREARGVSVWTNTAISELTTSLHSSDLAFNSRHGGQGGGTGSSGPGASFFSQGLGGSATQGGGGSGAGTFTGATLTMSAGYSGASYGGDAHAVQYDGTNTVTIGSNLVIGTIATNQSGPLIIHH